MKILLNPCRQNALEANVTSHSRRGEGGFAVLVVLILLLIMVSLAIGNNVALGHLQTELRLLERRQQQRRESVSTTNTAGSSLLKFHSLQRGSPAVVLNPTPTE